PTGVGVPEAPGGGRGGSSGAAPAAAPAAGPGAESGGRWPTKYWINVNGQNQIVDGAEVHGDIIGVRITPGDEHDGRDSSDGRDVETADTADTAEMAEAPARKEPGRSE
ncbi:hypothetical protein ACFWZ5_35800, partial [Streptomyces sp. NPDC059003]